MMNPNVTFVGGYGRSGSTLIDMLLDRVPGIVAVGEFRHLFGRAMGDNELCSCGKKFLECPFWGAVVERAFPDGLARAEVQRAMVALNRVSATHALRHRERMRPSMQKHAKLYEEALVAAYRAVHEVSGARAIIDSSKYPAHGLFLRTCPSIQLSAMLLVRDPRAVAHSWQRRRIRPEVHWEKREMPRHNVARSALAWILSNSLTSLLDDGVTPFHRQRYEDFTESPTRTISQLASFVLKEVVEVDESVFDAASRQTHTIAGNPMRLGDAKIRVRQDTAWRSEMAHHKQAIVTALCYPQMRKYGYPLNYR